MMVSASWNCASVQISGGAVTMVSNTARMMKPSRKKWSRQMRPTRPGIVEALARTLVGDELDGTEQANGTHFTDERVILEFRQHLGEHGGHYIQ